ncbi:MAG TPA: 50S ribosomal protein L11 methyltransferase [Vicinamibacterales bacterium]|nr:50S ribosomal protein L11 methyltransferase [Vicinamibacterales bacterium]
MPYRIDIRCDGEVDNAFERLVHLGALDVEPWFGHGVTALMPDSVTPEHVAGALGADDIVVSPAVGRDDDSVWVLTPRPIRIGSLRIIPASLDRKPGDLRLIDSPAFGTGLHPTTAMCLEAIDELIRTAPPNRVLDVGTGSGVLALAALMLGVSRATAIDTDAAALAVTADNARANGLEARVRLSCGGPEIVTGTWPLVLANILAAPLIEMAPALVRRVGHHGQLVLSGIASSLAFEVAQAYVHQGMHRVDTKSRDGWTALVLRASW